MLEVQYELNTNGVIQGRLTVGMLAQSPFKRLDVQLEELHKGELTDINEDSRCDQRDEDIPEEVDTVKTLSIKGTLGDISQHGKHKHIQT